METGGALRHQHKIRLPNVANGAHLLFSRQTPCSAAGAAPAACGNDGPAATGPHRRRRAGPGGRTAVRRPPPEDGRIERPCRGRQEPARHGESERPQNPPARRTGARHWPGPGPTGRRCEDHEITCFQPLLGTVTDLTGTVVAMHTQCEHTSFLLGRGAHYIGQEQREEALSAAQVPSPEPRPTSGMYPGHRSRPLGAPPDQGRHGQQPPPPPEPARRSRSPRLTDRNPGRTTVRTVDVATSLPAEQASPAQLAQLIRDHWKVEALSYVRGATFAEGASHLRTCNMPRSITT